MCYHHTLGRFVSERTFRTKQLLVMILFLHLWLYVAQWTC